MRWPKYWTFSFSIIPSKEHPGLISFRMDWVDLLAVTSWQIDGETVQTVADFTFLGSKITADGISVMKLKDTYSLEGKL